MKNQHLLLAFTFLLFFSVRSEGFTVISNAGRPAVWKNQSVAYEFHNIPAPFRNPIRASFDAWRLISDVNISFSEVNLGGPGGPRQGRNFIRWIESGWGQLSFRPPTNALAVTLSSFNSLTGEINYADIYFNAENFTWAVVQTEQDMRFIDVQNIATHEIGHMIGLDHSSVSFFETDPDLFEATMFYASARGETSRRIPKSDDQKGARSLYPTSPTPAPRIDLVEQIERIGNFAVYRVRGQNFNELTSFVLSTLDYSNYDVVSRYRSIFSSTEAEVEFDLNGFRATDVTLVAFNHPGELFNFSMNITTGQATANSVSANSNRGCSLSADTSGSAVSFFFYALILLALIYWRRQKAMAEE